MRGQKSDDQGLSDMSPIEGDEEEINERKGLKILTLNKLLARLPIFLAQMNSRNNSDKLKNETKKTSYLLYQHDKITKNVYPNLIKSL